MTATVLPTSHPAAVVPSPGAGPALRTLSVVLPCYDEALNLRSVVANAGAAAAMTTAGYEIVVVDDGSTDGTAAIAAELAAADPHVRVIVHGRNRGYGDALRTGIATARMDWVLLMDSDRQFDVGDLARFLPAAEYADALWGRRVERKDTRARRAAAAAWNRLVRTLYDLPVRDIDCGFKLIRRDVLNDLELCSTGALISTELAVRCRAAGARFAEIPVPHHPRLAGRETGGNPRVVLRAFRELAAMHATLRGTVPGDGSRDLGHPRRR
jgi:glycosyltransferase involved in cell wall biosynthesis